MVTAQIIKAKRKKGRKKNAQAAARPRGGGDNQSEETELVGAGMQKLGQIIWLYEHGQINEMRDSFVAESSSQAVPQYL